MIKFTKNRVLLLYQLIVEATGGTFGIRDENMLESTLEALFKRLVVKNYIPLN